jgi:hypothetical protein
VSHLKNSKILKIGIVGIGIVLLFVCMSSFTVDTKTFSDGALSFDYPGFFAPHLFEMNRSQMQEVNIFASIDPFNEQSILVTKNKTEISPTELRDETVSKNQNSSISKVLSTATFTNPNDIIVETIRMTISVNGTTSRHNLMYFKINNTVYSIAVYGPYSNRDRITDTSNAIFQSLK